MWFWCEKVELNVTQSTMKLESENMTPIYILNLNLYGVVVLTFKANKNYIVRLWVRSTFASSMAAVFLLRERFCHFILELGITKKKEILV